MGLEKQWPVVTDPQPPKSASSVGGEPPVKPCRCVWVPVLVQAVAKAAPVIGGFAELPAKLASTFSLCHLTIQHEIKVSESIPYRITCYFHVPAV